MLAVQTNSNSGMLPVIYDDAFNQPQLKPLIYKPETLEHTMRKATGKVPVQRAEFSSIGVVMPFQPSMWDDKMVEEAWNKVMEKVQQKMKEKYAAECADKLMTRLNKIFGRLNFNTHRKSLVLILTPEEEKVFYLNFPVKSVVFFSKQISVLDLAANILQDAEFYYLVLNKNSTGLYDYSEGRLRKVNENKEEPHINSLFKKAFSTTEILNKKNEKPVFITGSPNLVALFCNSYDAAGKYFPLLYHIAPYSDDVIGGIVKEIISHWNYWRSKFIAGRAVMAQQAGCLVSYIEAVLQALSKGADGLLLIDKKLKQQLQKPVKKDVLFQTTQELMVHLEKFLTRGNRIEIIETGVLKNMGGIALLTNVPQHSSVMTGYKLRGASEKGEMF